MNKELLFSLLVDLHLDGERQGPGSVEETLRAFAHTRLDKAAPLNIADIGCGTGASTLTLAKHIPNCQITAVDLFPDFLTVLTNKAEKAGVAAQINTLEASMDALPFTEETFDLIWSEGAIYNIGFKNGISAWKPFLKTGGVFALSEITWLHPNPPAQIRDHWESEYPEISTAAKKIQVLEEAGFDLLGYFVLPPSNWINNYYAATKLRIPEFLKRHPNTQEAKELVAMEHNEAKLYEEYQDWFSYGFYIATKR